MIDLTELYLLTWPHLMVTGVIESKNIFTNYITRVSVNLDGIWYAVETCWSYEPHTHFMSSDCHSLERTLCMCFCQKNFSVGLCSYIIFISFFQTWYGDRDHWILHFLYQSEWPWLSIKVTGIVWEIKNFCAHFLSKFSFDLDEISYVATVGWSAVAHAEVISHG